MSWKYWKSEFFNFLTSRKYWIVRSILSPILEILEIEVFNILHNPGNIGKLIFYFPISWKYWKYVFCCFFLIFTKKARAEISRRMVRFSRRDLSSETDSGPKTKTGNRSQCGLGTFLFFYGILDISRFWTTKMN